MDLLRDGLQIAVDGDWVYANGTSLGGDDGIAVAMALAILESDEIPHPRLEVILTVDEETGMDGAVGIDLSGLKGNRMINLDSEEEGIFLVSCAGGVRQQCSFTYETTACKDLFGKTADSGKDQTPYTGLHFELKNLLGGHSGEEIDKQRANAIHLFGRLLSAACEQDEIYLVRAAGGVADNAIPTSVTADLLVKEGEAESLKARLLSKMDVIRQEYDHRDPDMELSLMPFSVDCKETESDTIKADTIKADTLLIKPDQTKKLAEFLYALPYGVQTMSTHVKGLVETSLNPGILHVGEGKMSVHISLRSSLSVAKEALIRRVGALVYLAGGNYTLSGNYPGWQYKEDSRMRDKMVNVYKRMYGADPKVEAIHAGLECGILADKIKDLDCVSIGPDMKDIHTTKERLSASSTNRVWEFLLAVLAEKD